MNKSILVSNFTKFKSIMENTLFQYRVSRAKVGVEEHATGRPPPRGDKALGS